MAFHKFRLEAGKRCPAPVPIAPAVSPRGQNGNVRQHSRQGAALQELSDESLCSTVPARGRLEPASYPELFSPMNNSRVRCSRRLGSCQPDKAIIWSATDAKIRETPNLRRGTACTECRSSKTRCKKLTTGGCLQCLQQNKECTLYPPSQIASVEHSTTLAASRSFSPELHAQQHYSRTAFFDHQGAGGRLETDNDLDMDASATFQGRVTQATLCEFSRIGLYHILQLLMTCNSAPPIILPLEGAIWKHDELYSHSEDS